MLVVGDSFVEAHQTFFEPGTRGVEIDAIRPNGNGLGVGLNRSPIVLEIGLDPGQHHGPVVVAR